MEQRVVSKKHSPEQGRKSVLFKLAKSAAALVHHLVARTAAAEVRIERRPSLYVQEPISCAYVPFFVSLGAIFSESCRSALGEAVESVVGKKHPKRRILEHWLEIVCGRRVCGSCAVAGVVAVSGSPRQSFHLIGWSGQLQVSSLLNIGILKIAD